MSLLSSPRFLRNVIRLDAASCLASGVLHLAFAGTLADLLNLPAGLVVGSGLVLLAVVALASVIVLREPMPRSLVALLVIGNFGWVLGCIALMAGAAGSPTLLGQVYLGVQAAAVAVLAELEWAGLRRLPRAAAMPA